MLSGRWTNSHRCSWITVYVSCCNTQMNLIVDTMTCTCIVMHLSICQLPSCNLFTQHVSYLLWREPLVNCGLRSILLHLLQIMVSTMNFYESCCNAQMNLIVDTMSYTCIVIHLSICQLPSCNLFTQHASYLL